MPDSAQQCTHSRLHLLVSSNQRKSSRLSLVDSITLLVCQDSLPFVAAVRALHLSNHQVATIYIRIILINNSRSRWAASARRLLRLLPENVGEY